MSKEIKRKEANLPNEVDMEAWGDQPIVTSKDIIIPKLLVSQFMSERVKEGKNKFGDIVDSLNGELLGDFSNPVDVIPFYMEKYFYEFDINPKSGKREFSAVVKIQDNPLVDGFNDELPLKAEGVERDRVMLIYCLVVDKLAEGVSLPYIMDFRRTSSKAGKKISTCMYVNNRAEGLPPAAKVISLSAKAVQNDHGEYAVQEADVVRRTTNEELAEALKWFKLVKAGEAKADHSEDTDVAGERDVSASQGKF